MDDALKRRAVELANRLIDQLRAYECEFESADDWDSRCVPYAVVAVLRNICDHSGITVEAMLEEVQWVKSAKRNKGAMM
jgi:hypothetical protein